jgi:hypothetical protein
MSWERFLREKMGLADEASALEGYAIGPGFFGMEGVFNGELREGELDRSGNRVRIRLSSMVTRIQQKGATVEGDAVGSDGSARRARARHAIPQRAPEALAAHRRYRRFRDVLASGYCTWMHVSDPLSAGRDRPAHRPDKPTILSMYSTSTSEDSIRRNRWSSGVTRWSGRRSRSTSARSGAS